MSQFTVVVHHARSLANKCGFYSLCGASLSERYLLLADGPTTTWLGLAQILRDYLGPAGGHVSTDEAPGEDPSPLTIHNDRAKQELGWQPRQADTTIVETADSLRDLGLLEKR